MILSQTVKSMKLFNLFTIPYLPNQFKTEVYFYGPQLINFHLTLSDGSYVDIIMTLQSITKFEQKIKMTSYVNKWENYHLGFIMLYAIKWTVEQDKEV